MWFSHRNTTVQVFMLFGGNRNNFHLQLRPTNLRANIISYLSCAGGYIETVTGLSGDRHYYCYPELG